MAHLALLHHVAEFHGESEVVVVLEDDESVHANFVETVPQIARELLDEGYHFWNLDTLRPRGTPLGDRGHMYAVEDEIYTRAQKRRLPNIWISAYAVGGASARDETMTGVEVLG